MSVEVSIRVSVSVGQREYLNEHLTHTHISLGELNTDTPVELTRHHNTLSVHRRQKWDVFTRFSPASTAYIRSIASLTLLFWKGPPNLKDASFGFGIQCTCLQAIQSTMPF